jgi:hypothetical protein
MEYSENYNLLTRGDQAGFTRVRLRTIPRPPHYLICAPVIANRFPASADCTPYYIQVMVIHKKRPGKGR